MNDPELQRVPTPEPGDDFRLSLESIDIEQVSARLMLPEDQHDHAERMPPSFPSGGSTAYRSTDEIELEKNPEAPIHGIPTQTRHTERCILLHWWKELLSVSIAVASTVASFVVLACMNNQSMDSWKLSVEPNTIVAFLATLTRAAMMFPLAECLGHLKWTFFERPGPLNVLALFDVASRCPLGAMKFLWATKIRSPLASTTAMVTVLLLFFQPFMQQAIVFSSRTAPQTNETATITITNAWWQAWKLDESKFFPEITYSLYKSLSNENPLGSVNSYCSTSLCEYPEVDTLAICSDCTEQVISENALETFDNCTWTHSPGTTISNPSMQDVRKQLDQRRWRDDFQATLTCAKGVFSFTLFVQNRLYDIRAETVLELRAFAQSTNHSGHEELWEGDWSNPRWGPKERGSGTYTPPIRNLSSCENVVIPPESMYWPLSTGQIILESHCFNSTTELWRYHHDNITTQHFGEINGTLTTCSLKPCVQRFASGKAESNKMAAKVVYTTVNFRNASENPFDRLPSEKQRQANLSEGTNESYNWGAYWNRLAISELEYCADDDTECPYSWPMRSLQTVGRWMQTTLDTQEFQQFMDPNFTRFYHHVAEEASLLLQSQWNPNATNITGTAYGNEVYVRVRWPWTILPTFAIVMSIAILAMTIYDSSQRSYLFKNNILAAVAFELHGWKREEYGTDGVWGRGGMSQLEARSKRMKVRMELPKAGDGGLKLKKE